MQFFSIIVGLVTLGFAFSLSRARRGDDRYGIVLVLLPLALATPLVGLMASGLTLIYAYRNAGSPEGLESLSFATVRATDLQYVGHLTLVAVLGALGVLAVAVALGRQPKAAPATESNTNQDIHDEDAGVGDEDATPKAPSRFAIPLMVVAIIACIAAVATLSEFQDRFVAAPLGFMTAFDARDVSEFSTTRRAVEEQQRMGSNTLVVETFRTLVVVMLFLVLFDAFLVGSRAVTFSRVTAFLSIALVALAGAMSARAVLGQRALMETVEARLEEIARARAESRLAEPTEAESEDAATEPSEEAGAPPPP